MTSSPIEPDTKDWTWVLDRRCDACGFDPTALNPANLAGRMVDSARGWPARLSADDARRRPLTSVWSPLEYGAHVRDVAGVMSGRLELILTEDDPVFPDWDQDAAAVAGDYASADPGDIAAELGSAVEHLASEFAALTDEQWDRPGRRSNGSVFTAYTLGVYALHDFEHHAHDVRHLPGAPRS